MQCPLNDEHLENIDNLKFFQNVHPPVTYRAVGHGLVPPHLYRFYIPSTSNHNSCEQLALAWTLAQDKGAVPIPGTATLQHLQDNFDAAVIDLPAGVLAAHKPTP